MADFRDYLERPPPKVTLVNLVSGDELEAQFNPTELEESLAVTYAKQTIPGFSSKVKQFTNTEDLVESFTLRWSSNGRGRDARDRLLYARRFLMSVCYPRSTAGAIASAGAPRLLFVWPGFISLTSVMTAVKFSHSMFSVDSVPSMFTASVTLEEMRDTLLTSEDVLDFGTERGT